jgi:hypothetical protein
MILIDHWKAWPILIYWILLFIDAFYIALPDKSKKNLLLVVIINILGMLVTLTFTGYWPWMVFQ